MVQHLLLDMAQVSTQGCLDPSAAIVDREKELSYTLITGQRCSGYPPRQVQFIIIFLLHHLGFFFCDAGCSIRVDVSGVIWAQ